MERLSFIAKHRWVFYMAIVVVLSACKDDEASVAAIPELPRTPIPGSSGTRNNATDGGVMVLSDDMLTNENQPSCSDGDTRPCDNECGAQFCRNGVWTETCEPAMERCNDVDDDCDDSVDEDFANLGLGFRCSVTQDNQCISSGVQVCTEDGTTLFCAAEPVTPSNEICDGFDNDCDGQTDEDFPTRACCTETAQCPLGQICTDGQCGGPNQSTDDDSGNVSNSQAENDESCSSDLDCSGRAVCVNGTCLPGCFTDDACDAGSVCVCPTDSPCLLGVCLPDGSSGTQVCAVDVDCPLLDQICVDGRCINAIEQPMCRGTFDCQFGESCVSGECISDGGLCFDDSDCADDLRCADLRCIPRATVNNEVESICENARFLNGTAGRVEDTTAGASEAVGPSCAWEDGGLDRPGHVYIWEAPQAGAYQFDTYGSSFDTVLAVYDDCGSRMEVGCNDDAMGDPINYTVASALELSVNAGVRVIFVISASWIDDGGEYVLNYRRIDNREPMNGCQNNGDCASNERCENGLCNPIMSMNFDNSCNRDADCTSIVPDTICESGACIERECDPQNNFSDVNCPNLGPCDSSGRCM